MKVKAVGRKWQNPLASFRTQVLAFLVLTVSFTALALSVINQRIEGRTARMVDEYIRAITLANDVVYESFSSGAYLYQLVNRSDQPSLAVNDTGIIRHILVTDEGGQIVDSTDREDVRRQLPAVIEDLPPLGRGDIKLDGDGTGSDQIRTMKTSLTTEQGKRNIIIVISMSELQRVRDAVGRIRQIAILVVGALLILLVAWFSRRFTRPITELADAARRVAAGDLEFQVPVTSRDEVGALAGTFNEMLSGLRNKQELEEQLQRAERSAVVGRLASGIAHEIRNPLNFINLSIDHMREQFAPSERAARAEYTRILDMIKDEVGRLNRMVSNFLSYGRPARLHLRQLDARALVAEIAGLVAPQAAAQNVQLTLRVEGSAETEIRGDAEQLKTCFSNLMINAVQAMPEGGTLEVTLRPEPDSISLEFSDTGVGIADEVREQIFEPYYSTKETGIGLGLPLTRKIIEEHGGTIAVASEPGAGTTFTVRLPRDPSDVAANLIPSRAG